MGFIKIFGHRYSGFTGLAGQDFVLPFLLLSMCLVAIMAVPRVASGQNEAPAALFNPLDEVNDTAPGSTGYQEVLHSRPVQVNLTLLGLTDGQGMHSGQPLILNLFPEISYTAKPFMVESSAPGKLTWQGTIDGASGGQVIIAVSGEAAAGTVQVDGRYFRLGYIGDGRHLITEVGPNEPMPEHPPVVSPAGNAGRQTPPPADGVAKAEDNEVVNTDDGSVIDVLVAYTPNARVSRGGTSGINSLIDLAIAETNQAYQNSQIHTRLKLVLAAETNYTESGDIFVDLTRVQNKSDGYMDDVHGWRESVKADMVSLISTDNVYCGVAYLMTGLSHDFENLAFSVVNVNCATGYYSFGHELGHNMGAAHDRANASFGLFDYSFGYQAPNQAFRTIMAYNCPNGGCPRIQFFSNPWVYFGGQPTGIDYGTDPANAADNARSINNARFTVANWRVSNPPLPDPPLAPDGLIANPSSFHEINLSWQNHASNAAGITVERQPVGGSWQVISLVAANQNSYNDSGLPGDSSHDYRVRAYNLGGTSAYSNIAGATTFPAPFTFFVPLLNR